MWITILATYLAIGCLITAFMIHGSGFRTLQQTAREGSKPWQALLITSILLWPAILLILLNTD